jgi:hypothetical protein
MCFPKNGICDRILYFQKIVSSLGNFLLIKIIILKVVIEYGMIGMNDWLKARQ